MKKTILMVMMLLLQVASLSARPAQKGVARISQPDGSTLTLALHGDEWLHWNTTGDGYAVVKNDEGRYVYAQLDGGRLAPTALLAHDAEGRSSEEVDFLEKTGRVTPAMSERRRQLVGQTEAGRARAREAFRAQRYDYANFRGLVLLVEYSDCQFRYENYRDIMDEMINADNYSGSEYTNCEDHFTHKPYNCTGSMRDYFRDNSNGIFTPSFDVVGPVQISRSQYYSEEVDDEWEAMKILLQAMTDACTAADDQVNFKDYDVDGDGTLDMVYFIFAGLPSSTVGNNPDLLWPHQADMSAMRTRLDGVWLGRYACSTELTGSEVYNFSVLDGIGTMCHEFSHVLGLPDFYDTDYATNGQSVHPNQWSVMAGGTDSEYGRRPCGYSLFERYALGFADIETIDQTGSYRLDPLTESNTGYRINTPQNKEYFVIENRQQTKWDESLPGHGMLVFRVDSTSNSAWVQNNVNINPKHNYYELLRADGYMGLDSSSDPFPGTAKVTVLDNETKPANLLTWRGKYAPYGLLNISEQTDGVVTFDIFDANRLSQISLPTQAALAVGTTLQLTPKCRPSYANGTYVWTSSNDKVVSVSSDGLITGVGEGQAVVTLTANDELTAQCQVTVLNLPIVDDIATLCRQQEDSEALLLLTDAEVLIAAGQDVYLRDASGRAIILRGMGLSVTAGNHLDGTIYGRFAHDDKMPVLKAVDGQTNTNGVIVKSGDTVEGVHLHVSQLDSTLYAQKVVVEKARLQLQSDGIFALLGDRRVRLFNTLKVKNVRVPSDLDKRYDITAIYGTNTLDGQLIEELYLLQSPTMVTYTELMAIELPEAIHLSAGRTEQLVAQLNPNVADAYLVWTSSNEEVATVSNTGLVTALTDGQTLITVVNLENGLSATCRLTVGEAAVLPDIAGFSSLDNNSEGTLTLKGAQVVFINDDDAYIRDASGAIRFRSTGLTFALGDELNGNIFGVFMPEDNVPQLWGVAGFTTDKTFTAMPGPAVSPRQLTLDDLAQGHLADLVTLHQVQMQAVDGLAGIYVSDGTKHLRLYNDFQLQGINMPKDYAGRYYDVTGILITAKVSDQLLFNLALTEAPVEVDGPTPDAIGQLRTADALPTGIYTLDGQQRQHPLRPGIYVVRSANGTRKLMVK